MAVPNALTTVETTVMAWERIEGEDHAGDGRLYRVGQREVGHIHGNYLVDIPFPKKIHDQVIAEGRAEMHHVLPDSGWVSLRLRQPQDVQTAIELFRLSYDLAMEQQVRKEAKTSA